MYRYNGRAYTTLSQVALAILDNRLAVDSHLVVCGYGMGTNSSLREIRPILEPWGFTYFAVCAGGGGFRVA